MHNHTVNKRIGLHKPNNNNPRLGKPSPRWKSKREKKINFLRKKKKKIFSNKNFIFISKNGFKTIWNKILFFFKK
jgi:hypothetical protein